MELVYFRNYVKFARKIGVKVGQGTRFVSCPSFSSEPWLIQIGDYTTLSSGVHLITHDGGRCVLDRLYPKEAPFYKIGKIRIGNNCFIGMQTIILPNVTIADNCVIGCGSVVTKDVPSGQVWAGIPACYVCSIEEYRERMKKYRLEINWDSYYKDKEKVIKRVFDIDY